MHPLRRVNFPIPSGSLNFCRPAEASDYTGDAMKRASVAVALVIAAVLGGDAAASECGFSNREAIFSDDRAEDRALLNALADAVRGAGHACPKALAAARCKVKGAVAFDVFCQGGDFVVRAATPTPPFDGATVRSAK